MSPRVGNVFHSGYGADRYKQREDTFTQRLSWRDRNVCYPHVVMIADLPPGSFEAVFLGLFGAFVNWRILKVIQNAKGVVCPECRTIATLHLDSEYVECLSCYHHRPVPFTWQINMSMVVPDG